MQPATVSPDTATPAAAGRAAGVRAWVTRERVLQAALWLLGLMLVVPFLAPFKAPPIASFHPEAIAAGLGLLATTALLWFARDLRLPRVGLLPLAMIGLILLQLVQGKLVFHQVGLLASLYLLWACALVCLGGLLREQLGLERVVAALSWFVLVGTVLSAIIGWAQYIESDALGPLAMPRSPDRVWANLGQANQLADYLALGLASLAFLYGTGRLKLGWAMALLIGLSCIFSLTGSRTTWVYLFGIGAITAGFLVFDRSRCNWRFLAVAVGAVICIEATSLVVEARTPAGADAVPTAGQRLDLEVFAVEERPRMWKAAWLIFQEAPWLGVGLRQFGWHHFVLNAQLPAPRVTGFTDHAHNLPLQVMAELGLVGLAVLVIAGLAWFVGLLRQPRTPTHWWIWCTSMIIAAHSMLEYPLWYTFFLGPAALVLGMGDPHAIKLTLFQRGRGGVLLLAGLLAAGWLSLGLLVRDYLFLENFLAFRFRYMHASAEVNQQAKSLLLAIHRDSLLAPYVEFGLARAISVDDERLEDKLKVNAHALRLFPTDDMAYRQAMLLALHGDMDAAQVAWERAAASYPEEEARALRVITRRVENGASGLEPLRAYAARRVPAAASQLKE